MKEIKLSGKYKNHSVMVDDIDYKYLSQFKWYGVLIKNKFREDTIYVRRMYRDIFGKKHGISIHQQIMNKAPKGLVIDHEDRNPLNNQRFNLRFITQKENGNNKDNNAYEQDVKVSSSVDKNTTDRSKDIC